MTTNTQGNHTQLKQLSVRSIITVGAGLIKLKTKRTEEGHYMTLIQTNILSLTISHIHKINLNARQRIPRSKVTLHKKKERNNLIADDTIRDKVNYIVKK